MLFGQFSENCFAGRKKDGLHCKPFIKKQRTSYLFLLRLVLRYAILMVFTPQEKGSDPHSHHKRKFAHEEADSDRLREAVFGKGLQADHAGGNQRKGRCVLQSVPEYFSCRTELAAEHKLHQLGAARKIAGSDLPPIYVYAVETAIQMTLTELNENLREIYIEAYTQKEASEFIFRETAKELYQIFGPYQPELTARDFYDMEIGSASIMRGYMAHPCDEELTLEKKLRLFLTMSLRAYNVPKEETEQAIRFVEGLDIRTISEQVMQALFRALAMRFEFSLAGITLPAQK